MKHCSIACDTPAGILTCELTMPDDATIEAALIAARAILGERAADWPRVTTGIYGRISPRSYRWQEGDRIEIYRALQVDPRVRRRQRAKSLSE